MNEIELIPLELNSLKELIRLDLSNNLVPFIPEFAFANLTKLATLIMSYNKLQCIPRNSFKGLWKLYFSTRFSIEYSVDSNFQ